MLAFDVRRLQFVEKNISVTRCKLASSFSLIFLLNKLFVLLSLLPSNNQTIMTSEQTESTPKETIINKYNC
jgi:hypothetical protein